MMNTPVLLIHGGFFSEANTDISVKKAKQKSLSSIVEEAYSRLINSSAMDAVVFANKLLEDDPLFNAGTGSRIQQDGKIRMSASLMNGSTGKFSGVINISEIKNPIELAEILQHRDDRVLSGEQALEFARENGINSYDPMTMERREELRQLREKKGVGTVGCVALDSEGRLAAGTSTGGKGFEIPGRVSDSCTVAGNYADKKVAISCTGVGEDIVDSALAAKISARVTDGLSLEKAVEKGFSELKEFDGFAGVIAVDSKGNYYYKDSHPYMVYALHDGNKKVFK